jgi:hypothetical protein
LDAGRLVDREQERRDLEAVDEEVRDADRSRALLDFFLVVGLVLGSVTLFPAWEVPGFSAVVFWPPPPRPEPFEPDVGEDFLVVAVVDDVEEDEPDPDGFGLCVVDVDVEVEVEVEVV